MRRSTADRRASLARPWTLATMAAGIAVVLVVVFPRDLPSRPSVGGAAPTALSVAYLQARVHSNAHSDVDRVELVRQLLELGRLSEAQTMLSPLLPEGETPALEIAWLHAQIQLQRVLALPSGVIQREELRRGLVDALRALPVEEMGSDQLAQLASWALALEHPGLAADCYRSLASQAVADPDVYRVRAAQWYRAAGQPDEALVLYWELIAGEDSSQRLEAANEILDLHLEVDDLPAAVEAARELVVRLPESTEILHRAVNLGLAAGAIGQSLEWAQRLLALEAAADGDMLRSPSVQSALGVGALPRGLREVRRP